MQIVFASAEVSPVAKTGGLGDVAGSLPTALEALGHDVWMFMPYYRLAHEYFSAERLPLHVIAPTFALHWERWTYDVTLFRTELPGTKIPLILIGNAPLFDRPGIYSPDAEGNDDNLMRFTFFSRAVIRAVEMLGLHPDIIHAHDWHTALLPIYLHSGLRGSDNFRDAASVYTIHNLNYQGIGSHTDFLRLGLHNRYWRGDGVEHFGQLNLMKGGIVFADEVTTVSPTYAREIQTPLYGAGLDGLLRAQSGKVSGILNGIDEEAWNPATDIYLEARYSRNRMYGKADSKRMLSREAGIRSRPKSPLLGVVSRLVSQKGFDLLLPILSRLIAAGAQAVILGSGEAELEEGFHQLAASLPDECRIWTRFDVGLAHRITAASDIMLMPSLYEPCGLNQMYALRYGTLPVVRMTGGLADTVVPFDGSNLEVANGFGFDRASPVDLYAAIWTAMLSFRDGSTWRTLQQKGMEQDFSWDKSARRYIEIFQRARERRR